MPLTSEQVTELANPIVDGRGFDLEDVTVSRAGARSVVKVVVDSADGPELDGLAALSDDISRALDDDPAIASTPFTLEVTSRGVDRPLSKPRHWARSTGRMVTVAFTDTAVAELTGRIGKISDDGVEIVVGDRKKGPSITPVLFADVAKALVQVEFSRPNKEELRMCGLDDEQIEARLNVGKDDK